MISKDQNKKLEYYKVLNKLISLKARFKKIINNY